MKDTSSIGNLTQGMVLAGLLQADKKVLTPFGEGLHYDLLIDEDDKYIRVQCKTGKLKKNGVIEFRNYSMRRSGIPKQYGNTVDAYGVYCPQNGKIYLVPSSECAKWITYLREVGARNGQRKNIRLAENYVIAHVSGKVAGLAQR